MVTGNYYHLVISYKGIVKIDIESKERPAPSELMANFIKNQRKAARIIQDIINGESEYLLAQAMIHALANQN